MEYDIAILYFGLTRSVKKTHESHKQHIFNVLKAWNLSFKTFLHTWKTKDDLQNVWETVIPQKIDYSEHLLLSPDDYKIDSEDEFLDSINMDNYFYKDVWDKIGHSVSGEWLPKMVSNHLCMLESQKRAMKMVNECISRGDKFKYIMFVRPDITIHNDLPVCEIFSNSNCIHIPNHNHHEGYNDQFAILAYEHALVYGNRIDEIAEFRKHHGRIVGEKYCKFIIDKYIKNVNQIPFNYSITRP